MRNWVIRVFAVVLIVVVSISLFPVAFAAGTGSKMYVKEAKFTVQFPCDVWAVTQKSTINDEYFQLFGTELYSAIIQDLKTNSVYLEAVDKSAKWDMRVAVMNGAGSEFDMVGKSESDAKQIGDEYAEMMRTRGLQVKETYVITTDYVPFAVLHEYIQQKDIFMAVTGYDDKIVIVTISNVSIGSISVNELKTVLETIVKGLVFDNYKSTEKVKTQTVIVEELNVSLTLPEQMKWVTRSKGETAPVAENYNMTAKSLSTYMENGNYYMMSVDPGSESRVSLIMMPGERGKKNSILQSDDELLDGMTELFNTQFSSMMTLVDSWVWRNEKIAVACFLSKLDYLDQYVLSGFSIIDEKWYLFTIRDKDEIRLRETADIVFSGFDIMENTNSGEETIDLGGVAVVLPENWEEVSREIYDETGTIFYYFDIRMKDGSSRFISLSAMDICALVFGPDSDRELRNQFDLLMGDVVREQALANAECTILKDTTISNIKFTFYRTGTDVTEVGIMGIVQGYAFTLQWYVPAGDAITDDVVDDIISFIEYYIGLVKY